MDSFDYIVVGAGAAGSIVAYRLGEAGYNVLVVEAGPPDRNPYIKIPAGFMKTLFDPRLTWQMAHAPSEGTNGRAIHVVQGRTLGGSSSVNGLIYNRGQAADYDGWEVLGNRGWAYGDVLPFFKRTERRIGPGDDAFRGREGRLPVTTPVWPSPISDAFVQAAIESGIPFNSDHNGEKQAGVGSYQSAIFRGRRVSTADAFLRPAARRFAVSVATRCQVSEILFDGRRAMGVSYFREGESVPRRADARLGVVVSAGAINTPKLLQLSGIGPADLLRSHGIDVRQDLPGVGENLRDHYSPRLVARARHGKGSVNGRERGWKLAAEGAKWMLGQPSILSVSPALLHVFWKSDASLADPDYALVFTPASYRRGYIGKLDAFPGVTCGVWTMRPRSTGAVRIAGADFRENPFTQPNYFSHDYDRKVTLAALRAARALLASPAMCPHIEAETFPGPDVRTDDELLDFVRAEGNSSNHLVGTATMGPEGDRMAVLDERLRVRGIEGLSVIDSSIMPTMPSGNTWAATMMIAEKGADMLIADARRGAGKAA
ncbi:FAD-binding protein [Chelativorans sp. ZYF759]|uniref:GMC family oxidoreductase n=1 Tax=Chelativorans sp. ZYF759 TaxID=2692213 RepID=UPI00145F11A3|nr:GMC family oxidoreductase N-terminal domain-containing protein [Chelativorans sp. ZYF759]NMG41681.1 FAD-binding protein [Chelativorans sp. ZYF759]